MKKIPVLPPVTAQKSKSLAHNSGTAPVPIQNLSETSSPVSKYSPEFGS